MKLDADKFGTIVSCVLSRALHNFLLPSGNTRPFDGNKWGREENKTNIKISDNLNIKIYDRSKRR
jgi:hypothetical protein